MCPKVLRVMAKSLHDAPDLLTLRGQRGHVAFAVTLRDLRFLFSFFLLGLSYFIFIRPSWNLWYLYYR